MSFNPRIVSLLLALSLLAAACGRDAAATDEPASPPDPAVSSASSSSASGDESFEGPIPVESDGGIGDGAGPIPCFEVPPLGDDVFVDDAPPLIDPDDAPIPVDADGGIGEGADPLPELYEGPIPVDGDGGTGASDLPPCFEDDSTEDDNSWHGAQVAENDCPGMTFTRVEGSVFSFSIPEGFVQQDVQGVDSEIGVWENSSGVKVSYDFGQFSADLSSTQGAWLIPVNYSGIIGEQTIVSAAETDAEISSFSIYFDEVLDASGQPNKLAIVVTHTDPNDSLIGHCVVGSVDWT